MGTYKEFEQHHRDTAWCITPLQKIVDGVSSQWEGEHIRFSDEEPSDPIRSPKKWHCGTGHNKFGKINHASAINENSAYIGGAPLSSSGPRSKSMLSFHEGAEAGDIMFLHGEVGNGEGVYTHWGVFTGEIQSYSPGFNDPPEGSYPKGWMKKHPQFAHFPTYFHMKVEQWHPIDEPFHMPMVRISTLFEVTGYPFTKHPSQLTEHRT